MPARSLVPVLLAAALGGCFDARGSLHYDMQVDQEKYPVPQEASAACVDAAKRASHWCIRYAKQTLDPMSSGECNNARWDYARNCR